MFRFLFCKQWIYWNEIQRNRFSCFERSMWSFVGRNQYSCD